MLASAAYILKVERHREDQHGPCARMAHKFVKHFIFKKTRNNAVTNYSGASSLFWEKNQILIIYDINSGFRVNICIFNETLRQMG